MSGLFEASVHRPLADRMRPETIEDVVGQEDLLGHDAPLRRMFDSGRLSSFILWGPPGCGKTTLARIIAGCGNLHFTALSAVFSGVADLRKAFAEAEIYMLEELALMKPLYQTGQGYSCSISNFIPYRSPRAGYGLSSDKLKGMEILNEPLSACKRKALREEWIAEKENSVK